MSWRLVKWKCKAEKWERKVERRLCFRGLGGKVRYSDIDISCASPPFLGKVKSPSVSEETLTFEVFNQ